VALCLFRVTDRVYYLQTPCTHEASDRQFNYSRITHCIVTCAAGMFGSYLDLLLRYEFLIFDTYHPDSLYLREQGCDDSWVLFETKRGPRARGVGNTGLS
jgi:hypothetical protein